MVLFRMSKISRLSSESLMNFVMSIFHHWALDLKTKAKKGTFGSLRKMLRHSLLGSRKKLPTKAKVRRKVASRKEKDSSNKAKR